MSYQNIKTLSFFKKLTPFNKKIAPRLPEAYRKFYKEWQYTEPAAVHYIPQEGRWRRDQVTGEMHRIQNVPIPLRYPPEHDGQLWGGEGIIQGFLKKSKYKRRVPHFWFPLLQRSVVYSEVLNKHISVIITPRSLDLITANYGFDHYLLKTPACDLRSLLPLSLKRKILQELQNGCPAYADKPEKQSEILTRYKAYLAAYTPEEIEWYGYSVEDACNKMKKIMDAERQPVPLKHVYRSQLLEKLSSAKETTANEEEITTTSWIQRINPFTKKPET